jgi:hypothetical protein
MIHYHGTSGGFKAWSGSEKAKRQASPGLKGEHLYRLHTHTANATSISSYQEAPISQGLRLHRPAMVLSSHEPRCWPPAHGEDALTARSHSGVYKTFLTVALLRNAAGVGGWQLGQADGHLACTQRQGDRDLLQAEHAHMSQVYGSDFTLS